MCLRDSRDCERFVARRSQAVTPDGRRRPGGCMSGGGKAVEIVFDDPSSLRMALVLGCAVA
jgi:hypothetical protein